MSSIRWLGEMMRAFAGSQSGCKAEPLTARRACAQGKNNLAPYLAQQIHPAKTHYKVRDDERLLADLSVLKKRIQTSEATAMIFSTCSRRRAVMASLPRSRSLYPSMQRICAEATRAADDSTILTGATRM
jgi:hypothetical protein